MSTTEAKEWSEKKIREMARDEADTYVDDYDFSDKIDQWWQDKDVESELDADRVYDLVEDHVKDEVKKMVKEEVQKVLLEMAEKAQAAQRQEAAF